MNEEQKECHSGEPQLVSFRCYPSETAPLEREVMRYIVKDGCTGWYASPGVIDLEHLAKQKGWCQTLLTCATHWAELSDMVPTTEPGPTPEGDSLPASPSEAKSLTPTDEEVREAFDAEFTRLSAHLPDAQALAIVRETMYPWWKAAVKWMTERERNG